MAYVVVHSEIEVDGDKIDAVDARGAVFAAKSREEDGAIDYQLAWKLGEPTILRLLEFWSSVEAYREHVEQAHTKEWASWIATQTSGRPLNGLRHELVPVDNPPL